MLRSIFLMSLDSALCQGTNPLFCQVLYCNQDESPPTSCDLPLACTSSQCPRSPHQSLSGPESSTPTSKVTPGRSWCIPGVISLGVIVVCFVGLACRYLSRRVNCSLRDEEQDSVPPRAKVGGCSGVPETFNLDSMI